MEKHYLKYKDDVFRFALSIVKDTYLAEDITQECFLKLFENYENIRDHSKIKYWLFTTAKNVSVNVLKKTDTLMLSENLQSKVFLYEANTGFLDLIAFLSDDEQQLVSLKIIGKFKWKEIAKMFDCSKESVKKRYQRILKKIKNQLEEE